MSVTYVKEGKYFQTEGAENWKACLEIFVLVNGWTSSGMEDERKVRVQTRSVIRSSYMCISHRGLLKCFYFFVSLQQLSYAHFPQFTHSDVQFLLV